MVEDSPCIFPVPHTVSPKRGRNCLGIHILRLFPCFLLSCDVGHHVLTANSGWAEQAALQWSACRRGVRSQRG